MQPIEHSNALQLLRHEHRILNDWLVTFKECDDRYEQRQVFTTLIYELRSHLQLEEQVFYPALRDALPADALLDQAQEGVQDINAFLEDLHDFDLQDPMFPDKFNELEEKVRHHIQEESDLLPLAEETDLDFDALGKAMGELKQTLAAQHPAPSETPVPTSKRRRVSVSRSRKRGGTGFRS